jgi:hypothetical protein
MPPLEPDGEPNGAPLSEPADGDGQGQGEANGNGRKPPKRRSRVPAGEKRKGRKLMLPHSVFERLVLQAMKRETTASAIATEILDRELPQHRIATDR